MGQNPEIPAGCDGGHSRQHQSQLPKIPALQMALEFSAASDIFKFLSDQSLDYP